MRKKILITAIVAILTMIMILLSIPLLEKKDVAEFIKGKLQEEAPTPPLQEVESACPEKLGVYYFVDFYNTTSLQDDDVFIAILNTETQSYNAEIFVDEVSQGKTTLIKNSRTTLRSELITNWWRQGIKEPSEQAEEEEEQEEEQNQRIFYIDVLIEGCNETIASFTPTPPSVDYKSTTPAELGGGSRYSIDISKSSYEYFPD